MAEGLKITTDYYSENNNIVIIQLEGYVDQTNSGNVEKLITDLLKIGKRKLVFDLSKLMYISSAGWGIFVGDVKMVRDEGGDIVIAGMTPEVNEVFQMLEFFHIIEDFQNVEDAISTLNGGQRVDTKITQEKDEADSNGKSEKPTAARVDRTPDIVEDAKDEEILIDATDAEPQETEKEEKEEDVSPETWIQSEFQPINLEEKIDIAKLPLNEKIRKVTAKYPLLNIFQIRKMLQHEKFGYTKISIFKLYNTLKFLNLETKAKRYRYYRSV